MCCYYNPTPREDNPEHVHGASVAWASAEELPFWKAAIWVLLGEYSMG